MEEDNDDNNEEEEMEDNDDNKKEEEENFQICLRKFSDLSEKIFGGRSQAGPKGKKLARRAAN